MNIDFWNGGILAVTIVLFIWSYIWKGVALYRAGRVRDKGWFVALLLVNTLGLLEILYVFVWSKRQSRQPYLSAD